MAVKSQKPIKLAVPSFIPGQAYPATVLKPDLALTTAPTKGHPVAGSSPELIVPNSSSWNVPADTRSYHRRLGRWGPRGV